RGSGAVGNLGSLIGSAKRPTIVSCSSTLAYENVKSNNGYVGGMIGYVDGSLEQEDSNGAKTTISAGLIRTSPYNGVMNITTENGTSVGGLIGGATYTDISDNTIANLTGGTLEDIEININNVNNASGESNIGGIVGVANTECQVKNSSAYVKITITNENNVGNYKIGGLVGKLDVTTQSVVEGQHDISASYARLSVYTDPANEITVGGIAGLNVGGAGASIYNVVSQLSINESLHETEGGEPKPNENKADNVIVGGIVARSTSMLSINNAVSIMESNVHYDNKLVGGGIIGQTEADYIINNSASMGYIWANSKTEVVPTILGGLIGSIEGTVSAQTITNSYTVLTLSTAGINKNGWTEGEDDKYNVYANSVIGYTSMSSEFDLIAGVLYSSDYTLVLDDFATEIVSNNAAATLSATPDLTYKQINDPIVNVTASVLINNATYLQKKTDATPNSQADNLRGYIGDNWIWNNDHLPMPVGSQNMLLALGVFTQEGGGVGYNTNSVGKTYSPHILKETDLISVMDFDKEEYSYYLLADTKFDSNAVHTKLNGVILGNNATVNANNNFVEEIGKHSAITNIKFNRSADGTRGIAEKNNGTIFMCGMNYQDLGIYGGIVHTNNGVISYSYNSGNSSVDGAGLAYENTANAVIEHCYFTGSFYAPDAAALATLSGYAIAKTNEGYIGNSYSAGQATRIVENVDAGRHHKVHYDYYANYVSEETFNNLSGRGIVGLSTAELQATTDTESQVFGKHWSVFGMHNRAWINNDGEITAYMTYNYGYPIHRIKQYNGIVDYIPHQGKATGNGTFTLLASGYNKESVKLEAENVLQGRLVYSSYVDDCGNENHEYYDDCSYLINNIGVLNQINEIANETTANTYFELDANIQLPETTGYKEGTDLLLSAWPGISGFSGVFSSFPEAINPENEEYCIDTVDAENTTEKDAEKVGSFKDKTKLIANVKPKTIINLRGNALFNSATTEKGIDGDESNAVIANIMLNNSFVNDATLITSVVDADTDDTIKPVVTIYKAGVGVSADLVGAGSITALGTDAYGLVGTVGTTETTDITLNIHSAIYDNVKFANAKNIAGMVGTNYGTINVKNSFNSETGFELLDSCADATVAGFVNDNNKGLINLYTPITLELTISSGESMPISDFSG
ncbi:MAG: hypothetical protein IJA72_02890, partial [Clostridia bacterium]|nr:hypothetical protein [Clostridia bacterium]